VLAWDSLIVSPDGATRGSVTSGAAAAAGLQDLPAGSCGLKLNASGPRTVENGHSEATVGNGHSEAPAAVAAGAKQTLAGQEQVTLNRSTEEVTSPGSG
jgi:hypothetical protein